jgi:hypothetical protein
LADRVAVLEPRPVVTTTRPQSVRPTAGWTGRPGAGRIAAVSYKSTRPRWIRMVVGLVVVFIVLAIVGAAIGR